MRINMMNRHTNHFCLVLIVYSFYSVSCVRTVSREFIAKPNKRFNNVDLELTGLSKQQCASTCLVGKILADCWSVSWEQATGLCHLSVHEAFGEWNLQDASGWITFVLARYPVFMLYDPVNGYSYDATVGQAHCEAWGTTMATPTELLQARAMGLHQCGCGLLTDGTIGFVLQYAWPDCMSWYSEGIITCGWLSTHANVWCKFPHFP